MFSEPYSSPEIGDLVQALLKASAKLSPVRADSQNPFFGNRYASLAAMIDACRSVLATEGVLVLQYPVPVEPGTLGLVTKLVHAKSGQWQSGLLAMPLAEKDPQGYGSAMTYARRYGIATLVGLASEVDDDAERATPRRNDNVRAIGKPHGDAASLPKIDGVSYQERTDSSGRVCIAASGATREKAPFLKEAGFRWDPNRKIWWRYAA